LWTHRKEENFLSIAVSIANPLLDSGLAFDGVLHDDEEDDSTLTTASLSVSSKKASSLSASSAPSLTASAPSLSSLKIRVLPKKPFIREATPPPDAAEQEPDHIEEVLSSMRLTEDQKKSLMARWEAGEA